MHFAQFLLIGAAADAALATLLVLTGGPEARMVGAILALFAVVACIWAFVLIALRKANTLRQPAPENKADCTQ